MKHHAHPSDPTPHEGYGVLSSYAIGLGLSILLTLVTYFLVLEKALSPWPLMMTISALAMTQAIVQLVFFLHLGTEESPHWNLMTFLFMLVILVVIVSGTLWIMYHLHYSLGMS